MSNSELDPTQPEVSAKRATPAKAELDLPGLSKPSAPKLPAGANGANEGSAPPDTLWSQVAPIAAWALPATLVPLAIGVGLWWWKKNKSAKAAPPAPAKKSQPALDMYADWKSFHRRLPRSMRRVLDDLQPVIVLGNNASEKELLSLQMSRVADNEQLFPTRVSYRGKGLDLYLGARSLVLVPSDEFLDAPASSEDESWRKLLLRICRVRAPRVVVCLAQAPLDTGNLDEVTLWTSKLRAQLDVIIAVRNEDIELSVALVQAPSSGRSATLRSTDALFELLGSLGKHEGLEETLSLSLDTLADSLSPRVEERRESAKRWVSEKLRRSRKGWPRLLAHPEYDSARVLMLARFFEEFESWSASLGAGLAELLVQDERQTRRVLGQELCFVPCVDRRLLGTLAAFAGPSEGRSGRWRPKQSLVHRLVVSTAVGMIGLSMWLAFEHDKALWEQAATAAVRYSLYEEDTDLDVARGNAGPGASDLAAVLEYVKGEAGLLPKFFERDQLRCMTVESVRKYVFDLLEEAVDTVRPPEHLIQLIGLLIAGNGRGCDLDSDPNLSQYRKLVDTITKNSSQWRHLTLMSDSEIIGYLELTCPHTNWSLPKLELRYGQREAEPGAARDPEPSARGQGRAGEREWPPVVSVADFGAALESLSGQCRLTSDERMAIEKAETLAESISTVGELHGAALSVLKTISKLNTPATSLIPGVFDRYTSRLEKIQQLGDEHENVQRLVRDLRPFADLRLARRAVPEVGSLEELNQQLFAHLSGDVPDDDSAKVRLTADDGYLIDRRKVRSSLLVRALGRLQRDFVDTTTQRELVADSAEVMFFREEARSRMHYWAAPASIPEGVQVKVEVPWRYTAAGFRRAVLEPIETTYAHFAAHGCDTSKDEQARSDLVRDATRFIAERLGSYLRAYAEAWGDIYASFALAPSDDAGLTDALGGLSRPSSIQLALLREVLRQTRLEVPDGWPFKDSLELVSKPFDTLEGALNEKALTAYQGLILELANAGQDTAEASAAGWPAATAPAARPTNPEDNLSAFIAGLSGFGRVVAAGLRDPKADVRERAEAWAKGVGLSPASRPPLMRPIDAAYARGTESVGRGLSHFWVQKSAELRAAVTDRFPFSKNSSVDASVDDVMAWLDPVEGRFSSEVLPIYQLVSRCDAEPCVELPPGMRGSVERLIAIQQQLFDEKGEPKPLRFELDPVPFASQQLLPKRSVLKLGEARYEYFNTAPRTLTLAVPWNEAYVATLSVELAGARASDELAAQLATTKSAWALARLFVAASTAVDGRYTWKLDATLQGIRHGSVSVSYDVCRNIGRCGGLIERVFDWP